ncbi:type I-E CRISPR-associated protein Cse1/CasA [Streptomyces sp. RPA4-5]|uniref:type I-E CRISPR-associated protein Cse1/CasA n=1 Tax=Streptomyces sp. RPA4-5 TaxID=2721245 RepID=UPI00143E4929|nr:type I-E CRISPR-associated protein Cse1/CasA [Streptomyces sp. RPA4-5]QIY53489.1 type I-E CRISPR-associated protein Cse1/CasA [Streptomyces sp. RPA4-5]
MFNVMMSPCVPLSWRCDADPAELAALAPDATPEAAPGVTSLVSVAQALVASHLGTLDVPDVAVESSLRRLLVALFIRITGLTCDDPDEWEDSWDRLLAAGRLDPTAVSAYVDKWATRFNLHDPVRPFLQDPRLADECGEPASPGKLVMTRPSGNNQPWMNHTPQSAPVTPHEAFWWVLAWRSYGPSGLGANRSHNGITHKSMAAAPLRATISWHPDTGSEYANLLLSCPTPTTIPVTGPDLPEWEQDALPDPLHPQLPTGPVSRLINRASHAVLTIADPTSGQITGCRIAWRTPVPSAIKNAGAKAALETTLEAITGADDPFLINRDAKGPVRANHTRSLLRDFDSLIHIRRAGDTAKSGVTPPAWIWFLDTLPTDALDQLGTVRARALACHQDKQEKDELWFAQTTPVGVAAYTSGRHPEQAARVATTRGNAESSAQALGQALRRAWRGISPDSRSECPWTHTAIAAYWDQADALFWTGIEPGSEVADFTRLAVRIYDDATRTDASTPTGMLPIAQSRHILTQPPAIRRKKSE